ncbi:MAG TPA: tartrate-resistant acid phosphatase type 5 family protein [Caulobacteraceae bacterium]|nr:tartrate-resistant acid phosphatase type 5 family protein [Caulobacteraceae bacterium]
MAFPTLTRRRALEGLALAALPLPLSRAWAAPDSALTFLAVGDWGRDGADHQRDVADRMGETASELGARFIVSVGDNFYEDGVASVDDPAWKTSFEDVYTAPSLQVPWYAALGNHDYHRNSQAQIDYSAKSHRWRMPARYFTVKQTTPDGAKVEIFVLDTSPFIKSYYADGAVKVKVAGQDTDAQLRWFEQALGESQADWKIVVGHHPVYSGGRPGASTVDDNKGESTPGGSPDLIAALDPILQRHGVPLYLNGHDHDLQHVRRGLTDYVCTGAGSKTRKLCETEGSDFCSLESGFVACAVDRQHIRLAYRDYAGMELHVVDIDRSRVA